MRKLFHVFLATVALLGVGCSPAPDPAKAQAAAHAANVKANKVRAQAKARGTRWMAYFGHAARFKKLKAEFLAVAKRNPMSPRLDAINKERGELESTLGAHLDDQVGRDHYTLHVGNWAAGKQDDPGIWEDPWVEVYAKKEPPPRG